MQIHKLVLGLALSVTMALAGCLQDEKDPAVSSNSGKLTGAYYAAGLGNVAVQIQNAVMGDPTWFEDVGTGGELNLANLGLSPNALGAPLRSFVCPVGDGTSVQQLTWIDGRNENNKFSVKGIGINAGAIVQSLRSRVAPYQVGLFTGGASIELSSGTNFTIPSSCGSLNIPIGAPVLAFKIDRPAPPSEALTRTEYKTVACGMGDNGLLQRGTMVQKRVLTFKQDGSFENGSWENESMGGCMDDVLITLEKGGELESNDGYADLANFAAVTLRSLLVEQLAMKCRTASVTRDKQTTKEIDTCGDIRPNQNEAIEEDDLGQDTDERRLACAGSTAVTMVMFTNLRDPKIGTDTIRWLSGEAVIRRTLDNKTVGTSDEAAQNARRYKWLGEEINCSGEETFYVTCEKIPGEPALEARRSGSKWISSGVNGWFVDESWFAGAFNLCWFGSCTKVIGGSITNLNPEYFTGTYIHSYGGTTTWRGKAATSWADNELFKPQPVNTTLWRVPESTNYCIWEQRVMIAACPMLYDPAQQGSWTSGYTYAHGRPTALDPGINGGGSSAGKMYNRARADGHLTAMVSLLWEECNFKGCDYWTETAGPGQGVFIKSWNTAPMAAGIVYLSPSAKEVRTGMCTDMGFQLNSSGMVEAAVAQLAQKNTAVATTATAKDDAQDVLSAAEAAFTSAQNDVSVAQSAVNTAEGEVTNRTNTRNSAQTALNADPTNPTKQAALATATANLNNAQTALDAAEQVLADKEAALALRTSEELAAQTAFDAAAAAYNTAVSERNLASTQLAEAQAAASMGAGRNLTETERGQLQAVYDGICGSQQDTLSVLEQQMARTYCAGHYNSNTYAMLPGLGLYCDQVFDKSPGTPTSTGAATWNLEFKKTAAPGFDIQTTLLNTEGVMLAHKPTLPNNTTLVVTQRDFTQPLNCLRQEERYYSWPKIYYYTVCGGKGGCWQQQGTEWFTVTESTTRQWTGLSYAGGSWSLPSYGFRSPYGTWPTYESIPYPLGAGTPSWTWAQIIGMLFN